MRPRSFFYLALMVFVAALSSSTIGQQAPAGRQGAPGGRQGGPPAVQLPEGAGREQVQATCTRCHGLNLIAGSWGYTKDGWQDRIATMVKLPPAELEAISSYLAAHFPIKDAPGAVLISGPATVTIKEWLAPTLGSRPHDSHAAADGSIWWTGQYASKLGRLDPRTGQIREFDVPANSQPHGLAEDPQGNIWYTGIQKGVIGRLDPKTGQVKEYPLNDPGARGPHTPILDNHELAKIRKISVNGYKSTTLEMLFEASKGGDGLRKGRMDPLQDDNAGAVGLPHADPKPLPDCEHREVGQEAGESQRGREEMR